MVRLKAEMESLLPTHLIISRARGVTQSVILFDILYKQI